MKKTITFKPGYDKRDSDPSKNYGIHCMDMYMVLTGELGAISFCIYTGWYLAHLDVKNIAPSGAHIYYHSPVPINEGDIKKECCCWINAPCYSDGWYNAATDLFHKFIEHGEDVVWKELESRYIMIFDELK